jgi:hypothetical protein
VNDVAVLQRKQGVDVMARHNKNGQKSSKSATKTPLDRVKNILSGKKINVLEILNDINKVKPEQWKDPSQVEQIAWNYANKLGLKVPEQRYKQFMNAYKDATKNGPTANVDELLKKFGQNVDEKTAKEIKKFVPIDK